MKLVYREYGTPGRGGPPIVFLHGLFGSAVNWHSIARALEADHHILAPDLRNHGRSPHAEKVGYPAMAGDVLGWMQELGVDSAVLVGHSMGGKVAMWLALAHPDRVRSLVAVDIAPVAYPARFTGILDAMCSLDLQSIRSRVEAEEMLAARIANRQLRQFLLQNLVSRHGSWAWRLNLQALKKSVHELFDFSGIASGAQFLGPSTFLYGTASDYVSAPYRAAILSYFPFARMRPVAGAGHWVYADRPAEFLAALRSFLDEHR